MKKIVLLLLVVFGAFAYSCNTDGGSRDEITPHDGVNIKLASEGTYPDADVVYVDANLKSISKDKARFYLKKQLLGSQLLPNDAVTYDYWKDKQYFKDTPVINYIYHYYDVQDDKLYFSANASELEGLKNYIFHGLARFPSFYGRQMGKRSGK